MAEEKEKFGYHRINDIENVKDSASSADYIAKVYDDWADSFEQDALKLGAQGQIVAPETLAEFLGENKNARILDLAAGTGMAGKALFNKGFTNLDALDVSVKMLEHAKEKGIFKNIIQAFISKDPIPQIDENTYDGIVCTHAFTMGHVSCDSFEELIRITKPGGLICYTVRKDTFTAPTFGFQEKQVQLMRDNKWDLIQVKKVVYHEKYDEYHKHAYVCVFQVV